MIWSMMKATFGSIACLAPWLGSALKIETPSGLVIVRTERICRSRPPAASTDAPVAIWSGVSP